MKAKWYLDNDKKNLCKVTRDPDGDAMVIKVNYTLNWDWDYPDPDDLAVITKGTLVPTSVAKATLTNWAKALSDKLFFADDLG